MKTGCRIPCYQLSLGGIFHKLIIEGSTTCASGRVTISLYEGTGESRTFIGTANGIIERYAFSATALLDLNTRTSSLSIEYSIEAEDAGTVLNVNDPPVITTVSLADATEGVAYDDTVKATDPDAGDTITFAKVSGPDWITVGENGAVGGTPGVSDVGSDIAVSISAEDTDGAADTLTTSIAVIAQDVVVMADPDIHNDIAIPADRSSISLDFSNNSSLLIAFTSGEVADQIISVKHISTPNIAEEFPTVPAFTNAVHYIDINLDRTGIVVLTIYDVLGREVRTLVNTQQVSGSHTVVWDGRNNAGIPVASGTYISLLQSENRVVSGKLTLVR